MAIDVGMFESVAEQMEYFRDHCLQERIHIENVLRGERFEAIRLLPLAVQANATGSVTPEVEEYRTHCGEIFRLEQNLERYRAVEFYAHEFIDEPDLNNPLIHLLWRECFGEVQS